MINEKTKENKMKLKKYTKDEIIQALREIGNTYSYWTLIALRRDELVNYYNQFSSKKIS